jgi:hypothetical protein
MHTLPSSHASVEKTDAGVAPDIIAKHKALPYTSLTNHEHRPLQLGTPAPDYQILTSPGHQSLGSMPAFQPATIEQKGAAMYQEHS